MGELGQNLVGCRALPIDEPIGHALDPLAHGLEGDGDHGRRRDRQPQVGLAARADQRPNADHDADIHRADECGQRPIDQCAVEHDVDLVEAVTQDGHGHRARDTERETQKQEGPENPANPQGDRYATLDRDIRHQDKRDQQTDGGQPAELLAFVTAGSAPSIRDRQQRERERNQQRGGLHHVVEVGTERCADGVAHVEAYALPNSRGQGPRKQKE